VTTDLGTATSARSFFVGETPEILEAVPDSAQWFTEVILRGRNFTGATRVSFGNPIPEPFTVLDDSSIVALMDSSAATGPVYVETPAALGASGFVFKVLRPVPRPRLISVRDVPLDQGGRVALKWKASEYDGPHYRVITGYRVWRRAPATSAPLSVARKPFAFGDAGLDGFWESVAEVPAAFLDGYGYAAATLSDSTASGNPFTAFFVQALTADAFTFYVSDVDSGYSVDNVSPPPPQNRSAQWSSRGIQLQWTRPGVGDLSRYRVYRGSGAVFVPSPEDRIGETTDSTFVDAVIPEPDTYYKVTAVDVHGNEGIPATVRPQPPVQTLFALVRTEAGPGWARLEWFGTGMDGLGVSVERRTPETEWLVLEDRTLDGTGHFVVDDPKSPAGRKVGYRITSLNDRHVVLGQEVWVDVPAFAFGLGGPSPNPARGSFTIPFSLVDDRPARIELLDLA